MMSRGDQIATDALLGASWFAARHGTSTTSPSEQYDTTTLLGRRRFGSTDFAVSDVSKQWS